MALPQYHYNIISCYSCLWGSTHPTGSSHGQALGPRQKVHSLGNVGIETSPTFLNIPFSSHT